MISIITPTEAAALIRNDDILMLGGNGGMGVPEKILEALEERFLQTHAPANLTLFNVTGIGALTEKGICRLSHDGMVGRVIGGNYGLQLPFMRLIRDNLIEAYNFPQGVMSQLCRSLAAGQPGVLTHVGLGSYMDPRLEGGRMNERTTEDLVEIVHAAGGEWLLYRAPKPTIALIRGTTADEDGYVSMEHEGTTREDLSIAQAVHNAGGIVICQVKRLTRRGMLHPQMVKIPGFLIDHFVVDPDQMQTYATKFDPARCGETRLPASEILPEPMSDRRIIARRAAMQLRPRDIVNLGVGISAMIPNVAAEEKIDEQITLTVESGVVGGIPGLGREFGSSVNPLAIIDQPYQFDFYDGGGLTCAFLSFAEVDATGNVNVTRFGNRADGAGGFINISQNTRRLVFSGTFTGGGLHIDVTEDGPLIRTEGKFRKFVTEVGQISFSADRAHDRGQEVLFITERAVFRLVSGGIELIEIAPGIRLEQDILAHMAFKPLIASDLRLMDARLFRKGPMGLDAFTARSH
jgi:propionate CoA-transferase